MRLAAAEALAAAEGGPVTERALRDLRAARAVEHRRTHWQHVSATCHVCHSRARRPSAHGCPSQVPDLRYHEGSVHDTNQRKGLAMSGPYQLAPEEYPSAIAHPLPRLLEGIRSWLIKLEAAFAWYVDRWQR
jgi:hypothetical protein